MPFLSLDGWGVNVTEGAALAPVEVGGRGRAFGGAARSSIRAIKRTWDFTTPRMLIADAAALRGLINGEGDSWSFETDEYSAKGRAPVAGAYINRLAVSNGVYTSTGVYTLPGQPLGWGSVLPPERGTVFFRASSDGFTGTINLIANAPQLGQAGHLSVLIGAQNQIKANPPGGSFDRGFAAQPGGWSSWALVYDTPAGVLDLYRNGSRITDGATVTGLSTWVPESTLYLSGRNDGVFPGGNGFRDDLVVLPFVASPAMISAMHSYARPVSDRPAVRVTGDAVGGSAYLCRGTITGGSFVPGQHGYTTPESTVSFTLEEV